MIKIMIKYDTEEKKSKLLNLISKGYEISNISKPYRSGNFTRVYVDIK